jgi:hypothetical protein
VFGNSFAGSLVRLAGEAMPASPAQGESVEASIDLTQSIENPDLVRALERLAADTSDAAKDEVVAQLQRATFLMVILKDELETPEENQGPVVFDKGSRIQILTAESDDGNVFLPLFTDWQAIRDYTEDPVNGLIMPAKDAWAFALHDEIYEGVVINPAGEPLPLGRPMVEFLLAAAGEKTAAN